LDAQSYLKTLNNRYKRYFDVFENHHLAGARFDLYASFYMKGEKYVLSKKFKIYSLENNEHCLLKVFPSEITRKDVHHFAEVVVQTIDKLVEPHLDHMKTIITGVLVASHGTTSDCQKFVKGYRHSKPFMLYLKGWCEVRLVLVDLKEDSVICHPKNQEVIPLYKPELC